MKIPAHPADNRSYYFSPTFPVPYERSIEVEANHLYALYRTDGPRNSRWEVWASWGGEGWVKIGETYSKKQPFVPLTSGTITPKELKTVEIWAWKKLLNVREAQEALTEKLSLQTRSAEEMLRKLGV